MSVGRTTIFSMIVLAVIGVGGAAFADDVGGAAKAFAQAQEASIGGDNSRAADLYELADELSPSAPALRNAARARLAAQHFAMAATHAAELLRRYPGDKESRDVAQAILARLEPRLAQLEVTCSAPCTLTLDGRAIGQQARDRHVFFAQPGDRTIEAAFATGGSVTEQVSTTAGQSEKLAIEAPPPPPAADPAATTGAATDGDRPRKRGLRRGWAIGGAVVTVGLAIGATLQGMQTLNTRDDIKDAVAAGDDDRAHDLYDSGKDQQLRTNILIGASVVTGLATIGLAVFTDWSGGERPAEVGVVPVGGDGAAVVYGARF